MEYCTRNIHPGHYILFKFTFPLHIPTFFLLHLQLTGDAF